MKHRSSLAIFLTTTAVLTTGHVFAQQKTPAKGKGAQASASVAASASAPPVAPPVPTIKPLSESLTGDALDANNKGKLLFGDRDFAGARVQFQNAYDKSKDPRLLYSIAACEKELRHYAKVVDLLKRYTADGKDLIRDEEKASAEETLKTVEGFTVELKVASNVDGAEVMLDDDVLGQTPLKTTRIDIGTRKLRVRKADYKEFAKTLDVAGGISQREIEVKADLAQIIHEGRLVLRVAQESTISLDGKVVSVGKFFSATLPSGGHLLRITAEGLRPYQSDVTIQDQQDRSLDITLEKEPSRGVPAWAWVVGGAVVASGLGVGAYFLFKPEDKQLQPPSGTGPFGDGTIQLSRF